MKATTKDIDFARTVAELLRAAIRPGPGLYFDCLNAERAGTAELYEQAVTHMSNTGEWQMPDQVTLDAAKAKAWACLEASA